MILDKLKEITDSLIAIDEKIGFRRFMKYVLLGLCVIGLINFKAVVKNCIELVTELQEEIHNEKMEKRDELLAELFPILVGFRTEVGADRVLYFEYHNSKENLVGIPFKYIDLILQSCRYGVSQAPEGNFQDVNVGAITNLYEDIKDGSIVVCSGSEDHRFISKYPGTYELFEHSDGSKRQIYISLPGVRQPIGMIVLEWLHEESDNLMDTKEVMNIAKSNYVPRINALVLSKR